MLKRCSKCSILKSKGEYGADRSKKDGLTSSCRKCIQLRKRKRKENGGDFNKKQKEQAFEKYGYVCQICLGEKNLQVDHMLPQHICKPNKASVVENAWILCKSCNAAKGTRILLEVIKNVPKDILEPMLSNNYARPIANKDFERKIVKIGGSEFTEIKAKLSKKALVAS